MPSPDVRRYVDLTLFDRNSQSIYLDALNYARVALPEFQPREGSIETVLLQAMALEVAELVRSINRLPGGVLQVLLRLLDVQRSEGSLPTALVQLSGSTSTEFDIPAGIRMFYRASLDAETLVLVTDGPIRLTHAKQVSSIVDASSLATAKTATPHGFSTGQTITISGVAAPDDVDLNGSYTITVVDSTTFTFPSTSVTDGTTTGTSILATPPPTHPATGFVSGTSTFVTEEFNGLASGTSLDLLSVLPQVASVKLASAVSDGAFPESDDEYFARATSRLSRMTQTLVTANSFTQWAADNEDFPYIYRVTTLDTTGYDRQTTAGKVLMVVAPIDAGSTNLLSGVGSSTTTISDPNWGQKDEIRAAADSISHIDLDVNVADPMLVTVQVDTNIHVSDYASSTEAVAGITAALNTFLSPNTWAWSPALRKNELIGLISRQQNDNLQNYVDYVTSASITLTDATIPNGVTGSAVSSSAWSTGVLTVNTSAAHGLSTTDTEYVAVKINGSWEFDVATRVDADTFTVPRAANPGATVTHWKRVGTVSASTGDLTIHDPAPLLASGTHGVAVS